MIKISDTEKNTIRKTLLGVQIDYVKTYQALEIVTDFLNKKGKHYVVTPNPEMVVDAQSDAAFKTALNQADLAIPDSLRLGWGSYIKSIKNPLLRLVFSPTFLFPHVLPRFSSPIVAGVDLMEALLSLSEEKAYTTAYLGGSKRVADKLLKCLRLKYPKLKIVFCAGNIQVDEQGNMQFDTENNKTTGSKYIKLNEIRNTRYETRLDQQINAHKLSENIDIMFVAFGHKKQEKWMQKNLPKLNTRVMMGVGGAFDYLSGSVPRAPIWLRKLGLEWLFRVTIQPWRIKRFWKLVYFVKLVISNQ